MEIHGFVERHNESGVSGWCVYADEGTRSEPVHPAHPRRKRRSVPWANAGISAAMLLIGMFFAYGAYRFGRIHESNVQGPALVDQAPEHAALKDVENVFESQGSGESGSRHAWRYGRYARRYARWCSSS